MIKKYYKRSKSTYNPLDLSLLGKVSQNTFSLKLDNKGSRKTAKEHVGQTAVITWLENRGYICFSVVNETKMLKYLNTIQRIRYFSEMKKSGYRKGIPDIIVLNPPPNIPISRGLVIEMKDLPTKNLEGHKVCNCMSDEQKEWRNKFVSMQWTHMLAHGGDDAISTLIELGY